MWTGRTKLAWLGGNLIFWLGKNIMIVECIIYFFLWLKLQIIIYKYLIIKKFFLMSAGYFRMARRDPPDPALDEDIN